MTTGMRSWSKTAGSNNTADSNVNWAEGMAPSAVNNSARAEMASAAMWRDDNSGTLLTSGSTTAFTVTSNQTFGTYADGDTISVRFHAANDASATLNVDGVGAKAIQLYAGQALSGGEFQTGGVAAFTLTTTSTSWIVKNYVRPVGTISSITALQVTSTSTSAPGYSFSGDTNTGMYWGGADTISFLANGINSVTLTTDGVTSGSSVAAASVTASSAVSGATVAGSMVATQANQETGTSTATIVTPGRQHYHPSAAKAWAYITYSGGVPTLAANYNIASINDDTTGTVTATFTNALSSVNYATMATATRGGGTAQAMVSSQASTTVTVSVRDGAGSLLDPTAIAFVVFGDMP